MKIKRQGRSFARKVITAIIYMQVFGFACISLLKYNLDVYSLNYRNIESKSTTAIVCLEELSTLMYKHEMAVINYVYEEGDAKCNECIEETNNLKNDILGLMVRADLALTDVRAFEGNEEFDNLVDSINAYLNCTELIFRTKGVNSQEIILYILDNNLNTYIENADESIKAITDLAEANYVYIAEESDRSMTLSRIVFLIGIFIFLVATIVFVRYCRKILKEQEIYMAEAESANRAKTAFLSSMSHEIRTPINAIVGLNEMISREATESSILDYSDKIKSSSDSLLGLVNDVLDFSKIEAGKMELLPEVYNLKEMLTDVWNMIAVRANEKGLKLETKVDRNIPIELYGDSLRIKQVLLNILTNAVKYTETGSVLLTINYEYESDDTIMLKASVKDTGIGLNPDEISKLTKPFERLDEKRTKNIEGAGLGLSIVKTLLGMMDSKLEVESVYGIGSTFSFSILQKVENWNKMGAFAPTLLPKGRARNVQEGVLHAHRANVLAVDDNELNRMVIKELLKRTGINVSLASGGMEAVEVCKNQKFDVILMDHRMPDIDGVEALHMIREDGLNKETPAVVVTANVIDGMEEFYKAEGFVNYLSKPVNGMKLEKMLLEILPSEVLDSKDDIATVIDEAYGISTNGSEELYEKVAVQFVLTADACINEINGLFESGNIRDYTIKVHALKSASKLVGALELSKEAEYLEKCGNEEKIEEINALTAECLRHMKMVSEKLDEKFKVNENKPHEDFDKDKMCDLLLGIAEAAEAFDFDSVDYALEEADKMEMPADKEKAWQDIKSAIYAVDREILMELATAMRGGLMNEA